MATAERAKFVTAIGEEMKKAVAAIDRGLDGASRCAAGLCQLCHSVPAEHRPPGLRVPNAENPRVHRAKVAGGELVADLRRPRSDIVKAPQPSPAYTFLRRGASGKSADQ